MCCSRRVNQPDGHNSGNLTHLRHLNPQSAPAQHPPHRAQGATRYLVEKLIRREVTAPSRRLFLCSTWLRACGILASWASRKHNSDAAMGGLYLALFESRWLITSSVNRTNPSRPWGRSCCFTRAAKRTKNQITSLSLSERPRLAVQPVLTKTELRSRAADVYLKRLP